MSGAVLVVEDDRERREPVRRAPERAGHLVLTTGSGAEALGALNVGGIEFVVLDLGRPDIDGFEMLAAATPRECQTHARSMPRAPDQADRTGINPSRRLTRWLRGRGPRSLIPASWTAESVEQDVCQRQIGPGDRVVADLRAVD